MIRDLEDSMEKHGKKMAAPIIITVIIIIYMILYFTLLISLFKNIILRLSLGIIPVALGAVMIGVCVQRIKEIKGGEEDDLGKY